MVNFAGFWDKTVKPAAKDICETCKADPLAGFYVSQMMFYVEHDLADDRDPHFRIFTCLRAFNDEGYYKNVHSKTDKVEVDKLRAFGKLLNGLSSLPFNEKEVHVW